MIVYDFDTYTRRQFILLCNVDTHVLITAVCDVDTSVVLASGTRQLQANPDVVGPRLSSWKPSRKVVTTMRPNDLVVGEDHMVGPSFQRYNWQTGK